MQIVVSLRDQQMRFLYFLKTALEFALGFAGIAFVYQQIGWLAAALVPIIYGNILVVVSIINEQRHMFQQMIMLPQEEEEEGE